MQRLAFGVWRWGARPWSKWFSYERGGMERNEGRNERSGVQDKRAARTQEGGGKSVTNCGAPRTSGACSCNNALKILRENIVAAALVWRIFFYRRLTERDRITLQRRFQRRDKCLKETFLSRTMAMSILMLAETSILYSVLPFTLFRII